MPETSINFFMKQLYCAIYNNNSRQHGCKTNYNFFVIKSNCSKCTYFLIKFTKNVKKTKDNNHLNGLVPKNSISWYIVVLNSLLPNNEN